MVATTLNYVLTGVLTFLGVDPSCPFHMLVCAITFLVGCSLAVNLLMRYAYGPVEEYEVERKPSRAGSLVRSLAIPESASREEVDAYEAAQAVEETAEAVIDVTEDVLITGGIECPDTAGYQDAQRKVALKKAS